MLYTDYIVSWDSIVEKNTQIIEYLVNGVGGPLL